MPPTHDAARSLLLRAVAVPVVLVLAVVGYLVVSSSLAARDAGAEAAQTSSPADQPWRSSYSRRFPGCVAAPLWPGRATPRAVVVQWRAGTVQRLELGLALRRALSDNRAADARIIGACYR